MRLVDEELFAVENGKLQDFKIDVEHLLENIKEHYSYPIEEAVITENTDNCIDENYYEIHFNIKKGKLEILMLGDGIPKEKFEGLQGLAVTTKSGKEKLGRHGWGMKVSFFVANKIKIETKREELHEAKGWILVKGQPKWLNLTPNRNSEEDFTAIDISLKDEYIEVFTTDFIKKTLQDWYPTLLSGLKLPNRNKLKFYVNSEKVYPPEELDYEKKKALSAKVGNERIGGKIYLLKDDLEDSGIDIIVLGRKIDRISFGVYFGNKRDRIYGFIHANSLWRSLRGDKTNIDMRTSEWKELQKKIAPQLQKFANEIGVSRKDDATPGNIVKNVNKTINKLVGNIPELAEVATNPIKPKSKDSLFIDSEGEIDSTMAEGAEIVSGTFGGDSEGKGTPISSDELPTDAPVEEKKGDFKSRKEKRKIKKGGIETKPSAHLEEDIEARYYPGEGLVLVNLNFPTYRKAESFGQKTLEFHMAKCAIEVLVDYCKDIGVVEEKEAKEFKMEVLKSWGAM